MESPTVNLLERRYESGLDYLRRFAMGEADVQAAAKRLATTLGELGVPYAICGGLAVAAHGHLRATVDVDVLLTPDGLETFKERWLGRGWVERAPGSRGMRDAEHGVKIDVLLTGDFPGDGLPKPVRFPDPAVVGVEAGHTRIVALPTLIELKLASGMTAPDRLQDLADVIELIRANDLAEGFADEIDPFVREKFRELWRAAQHRSGEY